MWKVATSLRKWREISALRRWTLSSILQSLRADLWTHPDFQASLSAFPTHWPKIEGFLADLTRWRCIAVEPAA